jgi:uncharacterized membrane protein HdeD (DUF308 family)
MFLAETYPGLWWSLISALLAVLVGVMLITNSSQDLYGGLIGWPFQVAALSPTRKVLVMFFLIEGGASLGLLIGINMILTGAALIAWGRASRQSASNQRKNQEP